MQRGKTVKIKCDYCDSWINDFDETCPNCGATNSHYVRQSDKVPKTIEELKAWAKAMNLPLAYMRTFIGEDYRGPKAFGIYKDPDDGTFVVYKNKADGSRAVRYKGGDEAALADARDKGTDTYIAPSAMFTGKITRNDKTNEITSLEFTKV